MSTTLYSTSDIHVILGQKINGCAFLSLEKSDLTSFGVSFGFNRTVLKIIKDLV